jgi:hypothetical protein
MSMGERRSLIVSITLSRVICSFQILIMASLKAVTFFLLFNGLMFSNLLVYDARVEKVKERRKDSEYTNCHDFFRKCCLFSQESEINIVYLLENRIILKKYNHEW